MLQSYRLGIFMGEKSVTYSIGELAKEFDITTRSIRFYEDEGLLHPERKGQSRIYSSKDRTRLKLVLRGKRLGFSLGETKTIFDLYDNEQTEEKQLQTMVQLIADKKQKLFVRFLLINGQHLLLMFQETWGSFEC